MESDGTEPFDVDIFAIGVAAIRIDGTPPVVEIWLNQLKTDAQTDHQLNFLAWQPDTRVEILPSHNPEKDRQLATVVAELQDGLERGAGGSVVLRRLP